MKAIQDFEVYVDKDFNRVPYESGSDIKGKTLIEVKKGEDVPKKLLSNLLQFNKDWLDIENITEEEKKIIIPKKEPLVKKRNHSMDSLTQLINKDKKGAAEKLREILLKEFKYKSSSKRIGYLRNKILYLQERNRSN